MDYVEGEAEEGGSNAGRAQAEGSRNSRKEGDTEASIIEHEPYRPLDILPPTSSTPAPPSLPLSPTLPLSTLTARAKRLKPPPRNPYKHPSNKLRESIIRDHISSERQQIFTVNKWKALYPDLSITQSALSRWIKNADAIHRANGNEGEGVGSSRSHSKVAVVHPDIDAAVGEQMRDLKKQGEKITMARIKNSYLTLCLDQGIGDTERPKLSAGWLESFKRRHGLGEKRKKMEKFVREGEEGGVGSGVDVAGDGDGEGDEMDVDPRYPLGENGYFPTGDHQSLSLNSTTNANANDGTDPTAAIDINAENNLNHSLDPDLNPGPLDPEDEIDIDMDMDMDIDADGEGDEEEEGDFEPELEALRGETIMRAVGAGGAVTGAGSATGAGTGSGTGEVRMNGGGEGDAEGDGTYEEEGGVRERRGDDLNSLTLNDHLHPAEQIPPTTTTPSTNTNIPTAVQPEQSRDREEEELDTSNLDEAHMELAGFLAGQAAASALGGGREEGLNE